MDILLLFLSVLLIAAFAHRPKKRFHHTPPRQYVGWVKGRMFFLEK
jgi:hypothetical protein